MVSLSWLMNLGGAGDGKRSIHVQHYSELELLPSTSSPPVLGDSTEPLEKALPREETSSELIEREWVPVELAERSRRLGTSSDAELPIRLPVLPREDPNHLEPTALRSANAALEAKGLVAAPDTDEQANMATCTFRPGPLGVRLIWDSGRVVEVCEGSQAALAGVRVGWRFETIDGLWYTEDLLDTCIMGQRPYTVTFMSAPTLLPWQSWGDHYPWWLPVAWFCGTLAFTSLLLTTVWILTTFMSRPMPVTKDGDWLSVPATCGGFCSLCPAIVTYTGKEKLEYIDGAVMLGLSLWRHAPGFCRLCIVVRSMSARYKSLLRAAGWQLLEVDSWHPDHTHFAHNYWWEVYDKIHVFRIQMSRVLWVDADMYVWSDHLQDVLASTPLGAGQIAMVRDVHPKPESQFNSGLMFLQPNFTMFERLHHEMQHRRGWGGLDQPLINEAYRDRIVALKGTFNTHGSMKPCHGVTVAHYTGRLKPTFADVEHLRQVRTGSMQDMYQLDCPVLYQQFYCALRRDAAFLSAELQAALAEAGDCMPGVHQEPEVKGTAQVSPRFAAACQSCSGATRRGLAASIAGVAAALVISFLGL